MTTGISAEWVGLPTAAMGRAGTGAFPCQGRYVTPEGVRPKVAFIATHQNLDFSEHYLGPLMAERGFGFLGWNTRFRGDEAHFLTDHAIADIGVGTRWLREQGVETLVLLGNSGGGSLMATYQSHAIAPTLEAAPGMRLARGLDDLTIADLYISLAAHPGRAHLFSTTMDPSVVDERDPIGVDPELDMYDARNGPPLTAEFQVRYRAAQVARNERISRWALEGLERLAASDAPASDHLFVTYRLWADLRFLDASLDPNERTIGHCWMGDSRRANYGVFGIGQVSTLRSWLNMWSLEHSQTKGEVHLPRITQPSLVVNADGDTGIYPTDAQSLYDLLASKDKELRTHPGDHYFLQPEGTRETLADLLADWVKERS